ncbi:MAG: transposase [Idiomarina sp. T82-3]|nr:MAG: transposase [Idiomarina sp. T82-3]
MRVQQGEIIGWGDSLPGFDKLMWQTNLLKLFLTLTAVISGAEGWEEIEDFGRLRLEWLKKYSDFSHGIPVHALLPDLFVVSTRKHSISGLFGGCRRLKNSPIKKSLPLMVKRCAARTSAMSCQKQIVKTIVKKKADYCIAVKKSQKSPYQALQDAFELSNSNEPGHIEQHHGRVEYRAYGVLSALELPASLRSVWSSLATIPSGKLK